MSGQIGQYTGSFDTDACVSDACKATLSAPSSLTQGETFLKMHADQHGGKRRRSQRVRQRGGAAPYPADFSDMLPAALRASAEAVPLDNAFAQLPQFVGKYGMSGGRRTRRAQHGAGFGYTPGATNAPNYMILSPAEEPKAFLNPQWYTENLVVPTFQGPVNAMAQQSYNNQFNYAQRAGSRKRRAAQRRKSVQRKRRASKNRKH